MTSRLLYPVTRTAHPKEKPSDESILGFGKYFTDHMFIMDYDEGQGWHDGRVVPYEPFSIDPASCVLHYAQMMFEGMKAYRRPDGRLQLFRPDMNAKRMARTAERMAMPVLPEEILLSSVEALLREDVDWMPKSPGTSMYIRPYVFGNEVSFSAQAAKHYTYAVILAATGSYFGGTSGQLSASRIYVQDEYIRAARGGTGFAKVGGNYGGAMKAGQEALRNGCKDVLWLDAAERRYVEEIGTCNAFFKIGGEVITAPLSSGTILPGVTRDSVLTLLKMWGVPVFERKLAIDEVISAAKDGTLEEIFASGTAAVISPIGSLCFKGEDVTVGNGETGPLSQRLYDELYGVQTGVREDTLGWTYPLNIFAP